MITNAASPADPPRGSDSDPRLWVSPDGRVVFYHRPSSPPAASGARDDQKARIRAVATTHGWATAIYPDPRRSRFDRRR